MSRFCCEKNWYNFLWSKFSMCSKSTWLNKKTWKWHSLGRGESQGVASESPPVREPPPTLPTPPRAPYPPKGVPGAPQGVGPGDGKPRTGKPQTPPSPLLSSVTGVGSSGIGTATAPTSRVGPGGRVRARARETLVRGVKVPRGGVSRPRPPARGL